MTKQEAFKEWIKAAENHTWGYDDLWNAACDWQKAQDIKAVTNEYLVEPTTQADDLAYDQAIFDAINAIRKEDTSAR